MDAAQLAKLQNQVNTMKQKALSSNSPLNSPDGDFKPAIVHQKPQSGSRNNLGGDFKPAIVHQKPQSNSQVNSGSGEFKPAIVHQKPQSNSQLSLSEGIVKSPMVQKKPQVESDYNPPVAHQKPVVNPLTPQMSSSNPDIRLAGFAKPAAPIPISYEVDRPEPTIFGDAQVVPALIDRLQYAPEPLPKSSKVVTNVLTKNNPNMLGMSRALTASPVQRQYGSADTMAPISYSPVESPQPMKVTTSSSSSSLNSQAFKEKSLHQQLLSKQSAGLDGPDEINVSMEVLPQAVQHEMTITDANAGDYQNLDLLLDELDQVQPGNLSAQQYEYLVNGLSKRLNVTDPVAQQLRKDTTMRFQQSKSTTNVMASSEVPTALKRSDPDFPNQETVPRPYTNNQSAAQLMTVQLQQMQVQQMQQTQQIQRLMTTNSSQASSVPSSVTSAVPSQWPTPDQTANLQSKKARRALQTQDEKLQEAQARLQEVNVKKAPARVYIENDQSYKTITVTSLTPVSATTAELIEKAQLQPDLKWTIFEVIVDYGVERPLRDFEYVVDVMKTWPQYTSNCFIIKQFTEKEALAFKGVQIKLQQLKGQVYLLFGLKWKKVWMEVRPSGVYWAEDSKSISWEPLYLLEDIDAYTLFKPKKKAATKFCFAIKSQKPLAQFTDLSEYCRYVCVDNKESVKSWITNIRNIKIQTYLLSMTKDPHGYTQSRYAMQQLEL